MQFETDSLAPGIGELQVHMEVGLRCHTGFDVGAICEILSGFKKVADQGLANGVQQDDFQLGECLGTGCAVDDGQTQAHGIGPGGCLRMSRLSN